MLFLFAPPAAVDVSSNAHPHLRLQTPRCCAQAAAASEKKDTKRLRGRVSYDGTAYSGWQFQYNTRTIQHEIERVISRRMAGHSCRVVGASRTDAGVHALGQAFHVDLPNNLVPQSQDDLQHFEYVLNQMLPSDIRVSRIGLAPLYPTPVRVHVDGSDVVKSIHRWSAMYDSTGKRYVYRFCTAPAPNPLKRLYCHAEWRAAKLGFCQDRLRQAAHRFSGTHDFSAFANSFQADVNAPNPVRTLRSVRVECDGDGDPNMYKVVFEIDGAMYKMIRNIMGTMLDVACHQLSVDDIDYLFATRDRRNVPKAAPANGLCLEEVYYDGWTL